MTGIISTEPSVNTVDDSKSSGSSANPEISAEQEFCLYELETLSDSSSIGLVLRAIYDSGDVHKFTHALEKRITHYDKSILKVCTHHYQGFLDSIKQLRGLKEKCAEIRKMAETTDQQVQEESKELLKRSAEIVRYRRLHRNANIAIQQLSMCLPMLENYTHLQKLMEQKKYLQALKILEELEHNYLNQLHKYRFAHQFVKSIKPIRDQIREKSYSELTDFLEKLIKISETIGEDACKQTEKFYTQFHSNTAEKTQKANQMGNANILVGKMELLDIAISEDGSLLRKTANVAKPMQRDSEAKTIEKPKPMARKMLPANKQQHQHVQLHSQDKLDLGPVHRCCQIFNVMGDRDKFEAYYRKQRCDQLQLIVGRQISMTDSVEVFVPYLNEIVGFFVIENRIAQIQSSLVTAAHKDEAWELALNNISDSINAHFGSCQNVSLMLAMKKLILLFTLTTKSCGYDPTTLYSLLQNFRDKYNQILIEEYSEQFENALENDDYTPIQVKDEREYRKVVEEFPVNKRSVDQEDAFPRKFPFSRFVPKVYCQAKEFVANCVRFMEDLQLSHSEVSDTVRRYANILLAKWSNALRKFVSSRKRSLIQLIQITINMGYLERSCEFLERFIAEMARNLSGEFVGSLGSSGGSLLEGGGHLVALKNQLFRDSRSEVEQLIDEAFREKVQVFLDNSHYVWELEQSSGVASEFITDLITFLNTTFVSFTNLPPVLARHVCMQTCKFLADRMSSMLLSSEHRSVSIGALEQFSLDVMQCELFTAQCPVPGFEDNALAITFAHLRQLLDLVMGPDWTTFFAERDEGNSHRRGGSSGTKYARVKASSAAALLEKVIEFEKKNSGFFAIGRADSRDKQKLYETILRKLRSFTD
ncbi:hypothetical protein niasHT_021155 [Heterodera trifolii]|uniref:Exocyst complex component n=1 Tax=Heterodera trifolii TaxID=157864 RepID=A0ABD2JEZ6_9BILA